MSNLTRTCAYCKREILFHFDECDCIEYVLRHDAQGQESDVHHDKNKKKQHDNESDVHNDGNKKRTYIFLLSHL